LSARQLAIGQDNTIPSYAFQMLEACTWLMPWRRRRSALGSLHRATTMVAEKGPDKMVKSLAAQMLISRAQRQRSVRMTPRNPSAVAEKVGSQARALGRYRSRYWRCLCKMQPQQDIPRAAEKARNFWCGASCLLTTTCVLWQSLAFLRAAVVYRHRNARC